MKKFFKWVGFSILFLLLFICVQELVSSAFVLWMFISPNALLQSLISGDMMLFREHLMQFILSYSNMIAGISALIIIPIIILIKPVGETRKDGYALRWMGAKNILPAISLAIGAYVLIDIMVAMVPWPKSWINAHDISTSSVVGDNVIFNVLFIAIIIPFMEELLFRGAIYGALKNGMSKTAAVFFQAAIFGIMHLNPIQFCYAFLLGLCLGFLRERTNSIFTSTILHAIFNGTSLLLAKLGEDRIYSFLEQPYVLIAVLMACIVLAVLGFTGIICFNRRKQCVPDTIQLT